MTEGARIIPFRPRTTQGRHAFQMMNAYVVKGSFERHRRRFNFTAVP